MGLQHVFPPSGLTWQRAANALWLATRATQVAANETIIFLKLIDSSSFNSDTSEVTATPVVCENRRGPVIEIVRRSVLASQYDLTHQVSGNPSRESEKALSRLS